MKRIAYFLVVVLVATVGCGKDKDSKKTEVTGAGDKKLSLTAPGDTTIKPGETQKIKVKIGRDKFDEDVEIMFEGLPPGVTVKEAAENKSVKIAKGQTEGEYTLEAKADAAEKTGQVVKVTAKAMDMSTTAQFKLDVKK